MSQPNEQDTLAEAREQYDQLVVKLGSENVLPFEDWVDEISSKHIGA